MVYLMPINPSFHIDSDPFSVRVRQGGREREREREGEGRTEIV
jgi:hypothetical protein